ncbi:MAG: class I SAM-dependent methyltransferase [Desulfobulbaceae bacterium]|nr:class I SAM-dependent methyltransferase [Desulfobulbaceae bacterium]
MNVWELDKVKCHQPGDISVFCKLLSDLYDQSWYGTFIPEEVLFFNLLAENKRTLEIGSGTGRVSIPLLESGMNLFGIEGSPQMFNILQSKLPAEHINRFILWDARQTPYPAKNQAFECAIIPFSTFGLLHNDIEDFGDNRILNEINRLLVPGGLLIINDYRADLFDRKKIKSPDAVWRLERKHYHQEHGRIIEDQHSRYKIVPNRLFQQQIIRERRTVFTRKRDGKVLEEHSECIPLWIFRIFLFLGKDAGFSYIEGKKCEFHEDSGIQHIFQKISPHEI